VGKNTGRSAFTGGEASDEGAGGPEAGAGDLLMVAQTPTPAMATAAVIHTRSCRAR
jgi:hypothetical protein